MTESTEPKGAQPPPRAEVTLSDGDFVDLLADRAAIIVEERVERSEQRRRRGWAVGLSIVGLIGVSSLYAALQGYVDAQVMKNGEELRLALASDLQQDLTRAWELLDQTLAATESRVREEIALEKVNFSGATAAVQSRVDAAVEVSFGAGVGTTN